MTTMTPRLRVPAVMLAVAALIASLLVILPAPAADASHMELVAGNASEQECTADDGNATIEVPIRVHDPFTGAQAFADNEITVDFDTVAAASPGGTPATSGADYQPTGGTVTISPGSREGTAEITLICDDEDGESDEEFTVYFYNPSGATFDSENDQNGIATIEDGGPPPGAHFVIEDAAPLPAVEGDTDDVQFTIRLLNTSSGGSVLVEATDGSATSDDDYTVPLQEQPQPRLKTFAPGETEQTFTVEIDDDETAEQIETFQAVLSNPQGPDGPTIARGTANAVIVDDDAPRVSVNDGRETERGAAAGGFDVPFSVEVPIDEDIEIDWHTVDGSATSPSDYTSKSATTTIPADSDGATGSVTVSDDNIIETWEKNFYVVIDCISVGSAGCGESDKARAGDTFGQMTIQDDEPKISISDASAGEDETMTFTVTIAQFRDGQDSSVEFETVDGSATAGEDYEATSGTLTWDEDDRDENNRTKQVTVDTLEDGESEGNETFSLRLSNPQFAGIDDSNPGEGLITDDDAFDVDAGPAKSGESAAPVSFTGSADCPNDCTYTWDFGDGTADRTGVTVRHRFAETGTYTVRLTVEGSSGSSATDTTTATITDSGTVERSAGTNREGTAIEVSGDHWEQADTVLLATGYAHADALAAGPLAKKLDAPLLLTNPNGLPDEVEQELERLDASEVIIIGGVHAVPQEQADELAADGYRVRRIAGVNRFGTAADIATEVGATSANEVTIALGQHADENRDDWPDALSAGSFASLAEPLPSLLTHSSTVPQETLDALAELDTDRIFLLGGNVAISDTVEQQLEAEGYTVQRVFGADRYATSVAAGEIVMDRYRAGQVHPVFATGQKFPDGLTGGALAGKVGGPVVLVPTDSLDNASSVRDFLREHANPFDVGTIVGGETVVSNNVQTQARSDIDTS